MISSEQSAFHLTRVRLLRYANSFLFLASMTFDRFVSFPFLAFTVSRPLVSSSIQ